MRSLKSMAACAVLWLLVTAHVGSPDTWFQGTAGAYPVIIQIVPAGVVPGVAVVSVRVLGGAPESVSIQGNRYDARGGAPPPEAAVRNPADPALFAGKLWMMTDGSNSVIVHVTGQSGAGSVTVPVTIVAERQMEFAGSIEKVLAGAGIFLFAGLVTIVGAAVRESTLPPGVAATLETRSKAKRVMALSVLLISAAIFGGWKWWTAEEAAHGRSLFRPLSASAAIDGGILSLRIDDSAWVNRHDTVLLDDRTETTWSPLVADHGKLMHMFVVKDDMSAFAHLHPDTRDTVQFSSPFPSLPPGRYRIFGDVVHESGFSQTLTASIDVGAAQVPTATANPDDSWFTGVAGRGPARMPSGDGITIEWLSPGLLRAGAPVLLTFDARNANGEYVMLEPYMGMAGHAVVQRSDASVFVHLHPMGTVSMASQMAYDMREPGDTITGMLGKRIAEMDHAVSQVVARGPVSFPYAFPRPGPYRLWVQVKHNGQIHTAAFDASVADSVAAN